MEYYKLIAILGWDWMNWDSGCACGCWDEDSLG